MRNADEAILQLLLAPILRQDGRVVSSLDP
jgi:hypothetical protein